MYAEVLLAFWANAHSARCARNSPFDKSGCYRKSVSLNRRRAFLLIRNQIPGKNFDDSLSGPHKGRHVESNMHSTR